MGMIAGVAAIAAFIAAAGMLILGGLGLMDAGYPRRPTSSPPPARRTH